MYVFRILTESKSKSRIIPKSNNDILKKKLTDDYKERLRTYFAKYKHIVLEYNELYSLIDLLEEDIILQDSKKSVKGKKKKVNCADDGGNPYHSKETGRFTSKKKAGSWSIGNQDQYKGRRDCKRGQARMGGSGRELFLPKAAIKCGAYGREQDPPNYYKCSTGKPYKLKEEDKNFPFGFTEADMEHFGKSADSDKANKKKEYDRYMEELYKLSKVILRKKKTINKLKTKIQSLEKQGVKPITVPQFIDLIQRTSYAMKAKERDTK